MTACCQSKKPTILSPAAPALHGITRTHEPPRENFCALLAQIHRSQTPPSSQGCAGSTPQDGTTAGGPPGKQKQGADAEKDAAAAEIQAAAASFMAAKKEETRKKEQDEAAADIQGAAASYLSRKRAAEAPAPAEDGGFLGGLMGMFSNRPAAPAAPTPAPAA